MIDFHSHVLPGIDDGAKTMEDSIELVRMLLSQNVSDLVLTPHFHPGKQSMERFLSHRDIAFVQFLNAVNGLDSANKSKGNFGLEVVTGQEGIRFFLGAEVYINEFLLISQNLSPLCIKGTNLLLLEMPFTSDWPSESWQVIRKMTDHHSILPIIAHVERYPVVQKHPSKVIQRLIESGCIIQVNCDSFVEPRTQDRMLKWLDAGLIHLLGTDCHDTVNRPPRMAEACAVIRRALGEQALDRLQTNGARLLSGKPLHGQNLFF